MGAPKYTILAEIVVGRPYGHVPGHRYHDVEALVRRRDDTGAYRIDVTEMWGSAQMRDEEHGRSKIVAIDASLDVAAALARARAQDAKMHDGYAVQAISQAHAEALDAG